jgi:hypothetical protein
MAIRFLACPDSLGDIRAGFGAARQTPCFKQSSAWQAEKPAWCAFLLHVANACVRHMSAPLMSSTLRMGFLGPSSCPGAGYGCRASSSLAGAGRTAALRPPLADFGHVPEGSGRWRCAFGEGTSEFAGRAWVVRRPAPLPMGASAVFWLMGCPSVTRVCGIPPGCSGGLGTRPFVRLGSPLISVGCRSFHRAAAKTPRVPWRGARR